jgi:serine protease Do
MVTEIKPGIAQKMGILPGDILVTLNFKPIKSVKDLDLALKHLPKGEAVPVRIVRHDRSIFLPLRIK